MREDTERFAADEDLKGRRNHQAVLSDLLRRIWRGVPSPRGLASGNIASVSGMKNRSHPSKMREAYVREKNSGDFIPCECVWDGGWAGGGAGGGGGGSTTSYIASAGISCIMM